MRKGALILYSLLCFNYILKAQLQLGPIGSWRAHFSNTSIQQVIKGDQIYAVATNQIIQIDQNQKVNYLNTTNGLHSTGIQKIGWHSTEKMLVIAYKNSKVDIIQGDQITLIDDIASSNLFYDKTINDINIANNNAYLACNFGIVVIDLLKKEIKATIFPNNIRQSIKVLQTIVYQGKLFALTERGIWSSMLDQNSWIEENTSGVNGLLNMFVFKNQLYFNNQQSIYAYQNSAAFYQINNGKIESITSDEEQLYASVSYADKGSLVQLNSNKINTILLDSTILKKPVSILKDGNTFWVADSQKGLYQKNNQGKWIDLGGPIHQSINQIAVANSQLLFSYGAAAPGISSFNENGWSNFLQVQNLNLSNVDGLSIDPVDQSWWMGMGNQLIHYDAIKNNVEQFTPNSNAGVLKMIRQTSNGNMALLKEGLGLLLKEGQQWNNYPIPQGFSANQLKQFIEGDDGLFWVIGPKQQGVLLFQRQNNQAIWRQLNNAKGAGNLPSMEVTAITKDKNGSIWIGTDNGIAVFQCSNINEPCDAYLPIVEGNGFNGYLFQKETVHCIEVDGANRKWIGTNNGAWLVSHDGTEVLKHFTIENSPLPNNKVVSIGIEPIEGDVFLITADEMVSYKGQATEGKNVQEKIKVYPNPVGPTYQGPIIIRNLVNNALVKITDLNGQLIAQTRALGGQATWNGRDQYQHKVASGIYLIFIRDDAGNEKVVGKILITSGN